MGTKVSLFNKLRNLNIIKWPVYINKPTKLTIYVYYNLWDFFFYCTLWTYWPTREKLSVISENCLLELNWWLFLLCLHFVSISVTELLHVLCELLSTQHLFPGNAVILQIWCLDMSNKWTLYLEYLPHIMYVSPRSRINLHAEVTLTYFVEIYCIYTKFNT